LPPPATLPTRRRLLPPWCQQSSRA